VHCLTKNLPHRSGSRPIKYFLFTVVKSPLSYQARRELVEQMAPQYRKASRTQKILLLDTFDALTGYVRKYAMLLLNHPVESRPRGLAGPLSGIARRQSDLCQTADPPKMLEERGLCIKRLPRKIFFVRQCA
jgi:hypothetical protein